MNVQVLLWLRTLCFDGLSHAIFIYIYGSSLSCKIDLAASQQEVWYDATTIFASFTARNTVPREIMYYTAIFRCFTAKSATAQGPPRNTMPL